MRHVLAAFTALWLAALPLGAAELPALFDVTGVAADDSLNIRAEPDAGAEILGTLAPDATGVEISAQEAGWGRVNSAERAGWVSMTYMARQPDSGIDEDTALRCFGTEPFWSLEARPGSDADWSTPEADIAGLGAEPLRPMAGRAEPWALRLGAPGIWGVLIVRHEAQCSDGMSVRLYGLGAEVVLSGRVETAVSGCCTLQAR